VNSLTQRVISGSSTCGVGVGEKCGSNSSPKLLGIRKRRLLIPGSAIRTRSGKERKHRSLPERLIFDCHGVKVAEW